MGRFAASRGAGQRQSGLPRVLDLPRPALLRAPALVRPAIRYVSAIVLTATVMVGASPVGAQQDLQSGIQELIGQMASLAAMTAPGTKEAVDAILKHLQQSFPPALCEGFREMGGQYEIFVVDVKIGAFNVDRTYWPARATLRGRCDILFVGPKAFSAIMDFRLMRDDFGGWRVNESFFVEHVPSGGLRP